MDLDASNRMLLFSYPQVDKWFAKRRKQQREQTGEPAMRGRPKASAACNGAAKDAAAQQQQQQQAALEQQPLAMDMDAAPAGDVDLAAATTPAAALKGPPPAEDEEGPAAAVSEAETAMAGSEAGRGNAAVPVAAAASGGDAAAGPLQPTRTPATAPPPPRQLSGSEAEQLASELAVEAAALRERGLAPPLSALPAVGADSAGCLPLTDAALAPLLAGQTLPLSRLVDALLPAFRGLEGASGGLEAAVLRSRVVDLAARRSFGGAQGSRDGALVDALEDEAPGALWQWELRDAKHLLRDARAAAGAIKRRAARVQASRGRGWPRPHAGSCSRAAGGVGCGVCVGGGGLRTPPPSLAAALDRSRCADACSLHFLPLPCSAQERLKAVTAVSRLLEGHREGRCSAKLSKALDALERTKASTGLHGPPGLLGGALQGASAALWKPSAFCWSRIRRP